MQAVTIRPKVVNINVQGKSINDVFCTHSTLCDHSYKKSVRGQWKWRCGKLPICSGRSGPKAESNKAAQAKLASPAKSVEVTRDVLSCLYFNAQSVVSKLDDLRATVYMLVPDIVGITETWATMVDFSLFYQ